MMWQNYPYLYQYRKIDENLKQTVKYNRLKFSSPTDFNDPYDCNNIPIKKNPSEKDVRNHMLNVFPNLSNEPLIELCKKIKEDPDYVPQIIQKHLNDCGICCFSTLCDSILMWSHYADDHKGVCLRFNTITDLDFFTATLPVIYSKDLPIFNFFSCDDKIFKKMIQPKYICWGDENEVRVFKNKKDILNNKKNEKTTYEQKRIFEFKSEALSEIIFGTKTSEENKDEIKEWCKNSGKEHVKFSQMQLKQETYGLEKVDLTD